MSTPTCRSCCAPLVHTVIDLGQQPLSNAYVRPGREHDERTYPLCVRFCRECFLVQVDDVVAPAEIFEDYAYFSSFADSWVEHARDFVEGAAVRFDLDARSLVVEVASNDGYLLRHFVARGVPVLGIDPAKNVAEVAIAAGVPTLTDFLGQASADAVVAKYGHADLVVANNVLAHVPDLNDFVAGLATLVAPHGSVSIEVPHLLTLIDGAQFDTIYHEHFSYFSLLAASTVLARHGLQIFDVERLATHGGSLRIHAAREESGRRVDPVVHEIFAEERAGGLDRLDGFARFRSRVEACREGFLAFLNDARRDGAGVVAYGAAAKGNTLLNYAGVSTDDIRYVADRSPHKQGLLLPGSHLPIVAPDCIDADRPAYVVILPWNLRSEITAQLDGIREWGGRFVVAVPEVEVVP